MIPSVEELEEVLQLPVQFLTIAYTVIEGVLGIHHICTYPNQPSKLDEEHLIEELRNDEDFRLDADVWKHIRLTTIPVDDYITLRDNLIILQEHK